jgi:hypothetical protein
MLLLGIAVLSAPFVLVLIWEVQTMALGEALVALPEGVTRTEWGLEYASFQSPTLMIPTPT